MGTPTHPTNPISAQILHRRAANQQVNAPRPSKISNREPSQEGGSVPPRVRDLIKLIEADGWYFVSQRGSHRQYKHPIKPGRVTLGQRSAGLVTNATGGQPPAWRSS